MSSSLFFKVEGMTCASCEGTVQSLVVSIPGVTGASASHQWDLLKVDIDKKLSTEQQEALSKKVIEEINDVFTISAAESFDKIFETPNKHPEKAKHYFSYAFVNLALATLMAFGASVLPLVGTSMLVGTLVNIAVLGLMMVTGKSFYEDAWAKLKAKSSSMNTLIALSTLTAWSLSVAGVFFPVVFAGSAFAFMPIFMILGVANVGRGIRANQEAKAYDLTQSFDELFKRNQPATARVVKYLEENNYTVIPFQMVKPETLLLVKEGEPIPVDGRLLTNNAMINQKLLTGESLVAKKRKGQMVYAGTINTSGDIYVRATVHGKDNTILKLLNQVRHAQLHGHKTSKDAAKATKPVQNRMERIIQWFVPSVIGLAVSSGIAWYLITGLPLVAFNTVTSVLLCACPCALGLAAPLSQAFGIYKMLHKNILVKDAEKLQALAEVDTLIFDKTGTISEPSVGETYFEQADVELTRIIASIEQPFVDKHPIAKACASLYKGKESLFAIEDSKRHETGQGVQANINGNTYYIGTRNMMTAVGCENLMLFNDKKADFEEKGLAPIYIAKDKQVIGMIGLKHTLKPGVGQTLSKLKADGYKLILLTGDNKKATKLLTDGLPFESVYTDKSPDEKEQITKKLKEKGQKIAFIGDGMNDLKAAMVSDVSIAIQPWTHLASVAHVSLKGHIKDLPSCIELSKMVQNNIYQNLVWTFAYNTVSLLVATGALFPFIGMSLNPVIFAATMAVSSIVVVMNASRLPGLMDQVLPERSHHIDNTEEDSSMNDIQSSPKNTFHKYSHEVSRDEQKKPTSCCAVGGANAQLKLKR